RVHIASAEVLARLRVLDGAAVAAGATARVQLRLESPAVAGRGDRLVLRSYSPAVTIGGAVVADPLAGKRRRGSVSSIPGAADAARVGRGGARGGASRPRVRRGPGGGLRGRARRAGAGGTGRGVRGHGGPRRPRGAVHPRGVGRPYGPAGRGPRRGADRSGHG